jgi:phosphate transport system substrate-binding protein
MKRNKIKVIGTAFVGAVALAALASCGNSSDASIKAYTRDTTSGTRDGFFTGIGFEDAKADNTVLVKDYIEVASNGDMISSVKGDENAIGYISLSSLEESGVKGLTYEGVTPNETNVLNGTYKLTRNFNYCKRASYTNEKEGQIVDAFIAYLSTTEGKATIKEHGGILETSSSDVSWQTLKESFTIDDEDNSKLTIEVGGSTSVKSIVSNLLTEFSAKCGNFLIKYNPTGSGDAYKRTNGSEKDGANACDLAFASREFKDSEAMDSSLKGKMCVDAIVAVVNNKNSIDSITKDQLKNIYNGTTTKWADLK